MKDHIEVKTGVYISIRFLTFSATFPREQLVDVVHGQTNVIRTHSSIKINEAQKNFEQFSISTARNISLDIAGE